jgi:bifunctional DNA-binding transcriptional regulator/antitoxin component of YhaV-PrlF toxin-antitoxin module
MFEDTDQYECTIAADGSVVLPATLLEALGWRVGMRILMEQTDDGVLVTPIEVPGDVE